MVNYQIELLTIAPTSKCTGECPHCACNSSPYNKDELSFNDFKKVADQLPGTKVDFASFDSGGEPTLYSRLPEAIAYLNILRKQTGYPKEIGFGTNGWWATDTETAIKTIREYGERGLDTICVSANMIHYRMYKKQIEVIRKLIEQSDTYSTGVASIGGVKVCLTGYKDHPSILPLGRGKNFPNSKSKRTRGCQLMSVNYIPSEDKYVGGLNLFWDGYYVCSWKVFPIGNLNEKLMDVFIRKVHDPLRQLLGRQDYTLGKPDYGPKKFLREKAVLQSLPQSFVEKVKGLKECELCEELFNDEEALSIVEDLAPNILETLK